MRSTCRSIRLAGELAHRVELREVRLGVEPRVFDARDEQRRRGEAGPGGVRGGGQRRDQVLMHRLPCRVRFAESGFSRFSVATRLLERGRVSSFSPLDDQLGPGEFATPDSCW